MKKIPAPKKPRKKRPGKAKKPPAVMPPEGNATTSESLFSEAANGLPKWAEAILAQKDGLSAPSRSPDDMTVPQLWEHFEYIAYKLWSLSHSTSENVDCSGLGIVIELCLRTLEENLRLGGDKAKKAAENLFGATRWGCVFLKEATIFEQSRAVLKAVASVTPDWPVMLSPRPSSYENAKTYLNDISVGTASIRPTANMKDAPENRWRDLAVILLKKIISARRILKIQALMDQTLIEERKLPDAGKWTDFTAHPIFFIRFERELPEASKWKQVLDLPPQLNNESWEKWWAVAEGMLKAHWKANPAEAKAHFDSVKDSAKADVKTPKGYATRAVKRAFEAIAGKGAQGPDSIP